MNNIFSVSMKKIFSKSFQLSSSRFIKGDCIGGKTYARVNFEYGESFANAYKNQGFFGIFFLANYSHGSTETIQYVDQDLLKFLEFFNSDETFKRNTMLFIMSDHGPRFTYSRKSLSGLLKERNPFLSVFAPEIFIKRYPNEYENLISNTKKLLTPMDIYRTWLDLIALEKSGKKSLHNDGRSLSLFSEIPMKRSCAEAGIDPHFCTCLKRTKLQINDTTKNIANEFVNFINENLIKDIKHKCAKLETSKIYEAYLLEADLIKHQIFVDFITHKYFFQIETKNNNGGQFEFTVTEEIHKNNGTKKYIFDKRYISRINKYGRAADCIQKDFPSLREFCYCVV
ncbi:unnamed protein product [Brachionus calyciflorus]|uniref:Sulfatase N-terminal domain-containing protein n=1 Tax=Brachionus calyciflorus TaxID=104777 RepID=A0A814JT69_9BILA|nr:unnamed protein product [Brachionus calyciflorus]